MKIIDHPLPESCYNSHSSLTPTGIIIHAISARNIDDKKPYDKDLIIGIFEKYRVSAHYLVMRSGDILALVPEDSPAYHAGKSYLRGEAHLNNRTIGIEFVGKDDSMFQEIQYQTGAQLVGEICNRHGIDSNFIKMHSEVSGAAVRKDFKWDPGTYFDWVKFGALVMAHQGEKYHV